MADIFVIRPKANNNTLRPRLKVNKKYKKIIDKNK